MINYISAAGLFGLALYNLSQGDLANASAHFLAALAVLGLHLNTMEKDA